MASLTASKIIISDKNYYKIAINTFQSYANKNFEKK